MQSVATDVWNNKLYPVQIPAMMKTKMTVTFQYREFKIWMIKSSILHVELLLDIVKRSKKKISYSLVNIYKTSFINRLHLFINAQNHILKPRC